MNLECLTIQQALSYFNDETNLETDKRTFLIYCLENKISIKYKAITKFKMLIGYFITHFEYQQLIKHEDIMVDIPNDDVVDDTIFANGFFQEQSTKLAYNFYIKNFPKEYNSNLPLIQMNALTKSHELVKDTKEYKQLLDNKEYLDALEEIKTASLVYPLNSDSEFGAIVFHNKNEFTLEPNIYEFLDRSLGIEGLIKSEMKSCYEGANSQTIPFDTRFLFLNNAIYFKPQPNNKSFIDPFHDKEIFHQCLLKSDIDLLIKKLFQKEKNTKEVDILHPRTANNASKIISALYEINGLDITQPFGETNKKIMATLDRLGSPLGKDVIGEWLKLAHENIK